MKNKIAAVVLAAASGISLVGCQSLSEKIEFGLGIKVNAVTAAATATVNVTAVAAAFDKEGKVLAADIDVYQVPYKVVEGVLTLDTTKKQTAYAGANVVNSKKELGEIYGMSAVAGLEWFQQAEKLEEYFVGKTVEEIKAVIVEGDLPASISGAEVDAISRISIGVSDYVGALEEAFALKQAQEAKAGEGEELKVAVSGVVAGKATGFDITFGGIALDGSDVVVGAMADVVQVSLVVDAAPEIDTVGLDTTKAAYVASPANGDVWKSKRNLGAAYGMKSASAISKEWFEQADALQAALIGLSAEELANFEFDATTFKVLDEELLASVTIKVNGYLQAWTKAILVAE